MDKFIYKVIPNSWSDNNSFMPKKFKILGYKDPEQIVVLRELNRKDSFYIEHLKDYYIETKITKILYGDLK